MGIKAPTIKGAMRRVRDKICGPTQPTQELTRETNPRQDFLAEAMEQSAAEAIAADPTLKPSNPKDLIGSDKIPFHLWPETATILGALGLLDGALKYGRANWRVAGVRSSIYYDAQRRHMNAWFEAEDIDPDSALWHWSHALACIAILVDAKANGKLIDDRQYNPAGGYRKLIDQMTPEVKRLKEVHKARHPKHYTIADNERVMKDKHGGILKPELNFTLRG